MRRCWVARDKAGDLTIFRNKPVKEKYGCWIDKKYDWFVFIPDGFLPFGIEPEWEDEEPTEIEITIKLAEKEDEE